MVEVSYAAPANPLVVESASKPVLFGGGQYWLGASAGGADTYFLWARTFDDFAEILYRHDMAGWIADNDLRGAFEVSGTPVKPVPEPTAILLMGWGVMILIINFKRLRPDQKKCFFC